MFDHVRVASVGEGDNNAWQKYYVSIFNDGTIRMHCETRTRTMMFSDTFVDPDICRKVGEALILASVLHPKITQRFTEAASAMSRVSQQAEDDIIDLLVATRALFDEAENAPCDELVEEWHGKAESNG
jgi:hypothetical protein